MSNPPNILLIMADQLSAPFLRPYGGTAVVSPAIDALANEGVVFRSAYSNSPLCAPARFSMMSGRLNSTIGAYDNASEFPSTIPTFAHHLRAAGYQTTLIGKMHFVGADQLHGYEERLTTDIYPADFGWTPNWSDPNGRFDWWFHNMDSVIGAGVADASNQLDYDDDVGHHTIRKLRDLARTDDQRPWFLTASFTHPHDPYIARQEFWDLYEHIEIPAPTVSVSHLETDDPHSTRLRRVIAADATAVTAAQIRKARRAYFASISYVDEWISRIRATLSQHRMADDTVIIFTADHGDMLGERGLWYKMNFFEHSARVPFILHHPTRFEPSVIESHVSLIDIAPTLLDLAGIEIPSTLDGSSVLPLIDADEPARGVLGEYLGEGAIAPIFMIRRGQWKFVWSEPDPAQLYDLDADPSELHNLASGSEQRDLVAEFTAEVHERWDVHTIRQQVLASQSSRQLVDRALRQGRFAAWDYQPSTNAAEQYMRNHLDLNQVESSRRSL